MERGRDGERERWSEGRSTASEEQRLDWFVKLRMWEKIEGRSTASEEQRLGWLVKLKIYETE